VFFTRHSLWLLLGLILIYPSEKEGWLQYIYAYPRGGRSSQDLIVRRLYAKLDPYLSAAVTRRPHGNEMNEFTTKVHTAEDQARAHWRDVENQFEAQEMEMKDVRQSLTAAGTRTSKTCGSCAKRS